MTEREQLNSLTARFLRLNDEGKVYMSIVTRQLTRICGAQAVRDDAHREFVAASGDGMEGDSRQEHPA